MQSPLGWGRGLRTLVGSAVVVLALSSASGCKRVLQLVNKKTDVAEPAASAAEIEPPSVGGKMNGYIVHCLNQFTDNVMNSEEHYFSWAGKEGPSEKSKNIKGILSTYIDPKRCADAVAKSNAMQPKDAALEGMATQYAGSLEALRPLLDEARVYYENRGYKSDQFSKAKELHLKLVKAFGDFDASNQALNDKIDQLQDQEDQRTLVKLEKSEGRKLPFLVRAMLAQAKAISRSTRRPWAQIQVAEFKKAFSDYDTLVKELVAYRDAHGAEAHQAGVQSYVLAQEKLVRFTRDFLHRVEDQKPFNENELRMLDAAPPQIMRQYNTVVNDYNNLR